MTSRQTVEQVREVVRALATLLSTHEHPSEARWLEEAWVTLGDDTQPPDVVAETLGKLHRIVPGMGGLVDINLADLPGETPRAATHELVRLADELYELTR